MKNIILILLSIILLFGCTQNTAPTDEKNQTNTSINLIAKPGDLVTVDYVGYLDDGTVFDTSLESIALKFNLEPRSSYAPLEFIVGSGQMISGFDAGVVGMKVGENKTIHLTPDQAYGESKPALIITFPIEMMPENISIGTILVTKDNKRAKIVNMTNETATVDFNDELAGKNLNFKILMREIK